MVDNDVQAITAISPSNESELRVIKEVLECDLENGQSLVEMRLSELRPEQEGSSIESFLRSFWNFFEAIRVVRAENDFSRAIFLLNLAVDGFRGLGIGDLEALCRGMSAYASAAVELRALNINRGLALFADTESYLQNAGQYGRRFQPMIDHMKPDALFTGAIPALLNADYNSAKEIIARASDASRSVAAKYYEERSKEHFTFIGLAKLYEAFFDYLQAQADLIVLDLERITSKDISKNAREAATLLAQGDLENISIQSNYYLSRALVDLGTVTNGIAERMRRCLNATFKPDLEGFQELRTAVGRAMDDLSKAGPLAVPLLRAADAHAARVRNLERLARPKKSDFGIFSGVISVALFLPLLLVAAWTTSTFGIDLSGRMLFGTVSVLALIGGFGYSALRFKSLLFSAIRSDEEESASSAGTTG